MAKRKPLVMKDQDPKFNPDVANAPQGRFEVFSCGDVIMATHANGAWKDDSGANISVDGWRAKVKGEKKAAEKPVALEYDPSKDVTLKKTAPDAAAIDKTG